MAKKKQNKMAILANKSYGLYYGQVVDFDPVAGVARVAGCRHVCRWFGLTGGITSLAEHGLCGPRADESRIGAAVSGVSVLTGIVNVFEVSASAQATFDAAVPE